jgi:tetratricopeptide (TPR) repeat protein
MMMRVFLFCMTFLAGGVQTVVAQPSAQTNGDIRECLAAAKAGNNLEACSRVIDNPSASKASVVVAYLERGHFYSRSREYKLARVDFERVVELAPNDYRAYVGRGNANNNLREYEAAIRDFDKVLLIDPGNYRAISSRGFSYEWSGKHEAALASYTAALAMRPNDVWSLNRRGTVRLNAGEYDLAIQDLNAALAAEPRALVAHLNRAAAYEKLGRMAEAVADYTLIVETPAGRVGVIDDETAKRVAPARLSSLQKKIAAGNARAVPEKRVALVIGNSGYTHAGALKNPESDAKAVAKTFRDVGFTDVRERFNLSHADLARELKEFGDLASEADWAVIYYAGHGMEMGGVNYLIPIDAKLEQPSHVEDEAMPLTRVLGKVAGAGKLQMVILDACRNNPFAARLQKSGRMTRSLTRGLAAVEPDAGTLLVYASRDGTVALDGEGANSPFTEALITHLVEPGLEISLLFRKVRDSVMGKTGRQQEPFTYGSLPAQALFFKAR